MSIDINSINNLNLRSDFENGNISKDLEFKFEGYVGNRPQDFEGEEHEDDTWAIDVTKGVEIESYLYSSEFEYNQDMGILMAWLDDEEDDYDDLPYDEDEVEFEPECDEVNDVSIRITNRLIKMGFVPDCGDTDDETEFEVQDMIREVIHASELKLSK